MLIRQNKKGKAREETGRIHALLPKFSQIRLKYSLKLYGHTDMSFENLAPIS